LAGPTTIRPASTAKPAKLILASSTSRVVAALSQLYHLVAPRATLERTIVESAQDQFSGLIGLTRAFMGDRCASFAGLGRADRASDVLFGVSIERQRLRASWTCAVESWPEIRGPVTLTS
jgi:hypothetical protein